MSELDSHRNVFKSAFSLIVLGICLTITFTCLSETCEAFGQSEALKTVHTESSNILDPIKIVQLLVDGKEVHRGIPFQAGPDWLQHLTVVIQNKSGKDLTAAQIMIDFPELGDGSHERPIVGTQIRIGQRPEHALYSQSGEKIRAESTAPIRIAPGSTVSFSFSDFMDRIRSTVAGYRDPADLNQCWIRLQVFFFSDGTRWIKGMYTRPDPATPGKYIPISRDDFEGKSTSIK